MLPCVWPALNPLSIHATFTAIVPESVCLRLIAETGASFLYSIDTLLFCASPRPAAALCGILLDSEWQMARSLYGKSKLRAAAVQQRSPSFPTAGASVAWKSIKIEEHKVTSLYNNTDVLSVCVNVCQCTWLSGNTRLQNDLLCVDCWVHTAIN